jgi:tetratricopeptide (TPR) repeat protein
MAEPVSNGDEEFRQSLFLGDQYRSSGLLGKAVEEYRKAVDLKPDDPDVYARLGFALTEMEEFEDAVKAYRRYVALRPKDCNSHASLAFSYMKQGLSDQAIVSYEHAMELCPDSADPYIQLGKAYLAGGYELEGIEAFRRGVEVSPDDPRPYDNLAAALFDRRLFPEAAAAYEALLALPAHGHDAAWESWAHGRVAYAYRWGGAFDRAAPHYVHILDYHKSVGTDPSDRSYFNALRGLATAYTETGQVDAAIQLYDELISVKSDRAGYYYQLGELLNDAGRYREAVTRVKQGLGFDMNCGAHAHCVLGRAYEKLLEYDPAKREFEIAVRCNDPRFNDYATKQIERQEQLIKIRELKAQKEKYGY